MDLSTSKYIQLTPYALLEFTYNTTVISTDDLSFIRVKNAFTGTMSYINYHLTDYRKTRQLTGNALDRTVQQISASKWAHMDIDKPISYFEQKHANLFFENLWDSISQDLNITYDSVKVHLQSGYNFTDLAGFILRIAFVDNEFHQLYLANIAHLKDDEFIKYHTRPILLGERVYDRYLEVKIPSLKDIKDVNTQVADEFATVDGIFLKKDFNWDNSKINVLFYEIKEKEVDRDGQVILRTSLNVGDSASGMVRVELKHFDEFVNVAAVIQESLNGDYFEIFPTYNDNFLEDFILERAEQGENYMVIHDLEIYEQRPNSGSMIETMTQKFTQIQEEGFDKPFIFRPVVKDENTLTFSIDYSVRIFNKVDSSQIIRRASLTFSNARKYGRWMQKLDIPIDFNPIRVVNKILLETEKESVSNPNLYTLNSGMLKNSLASDNTFLPMQINDIYTGVETLFVDKISQSIISADSGNTANTVFDLKPLLKSDLIFGQGEARLYIGEYDNFVKFKVYKMSENTNVPEPYTDMSQNANVNFYLVFTTADGTKIKISEYNKMENINLDKKEGELLYKIDSRLSRQILASDVLTFTINIENRQIETDEVGNATDKKDFELIFYSGVWAPIADHKLYNSVNYETRQLLIDSKLAKMEQNELILRELQDNFQNFISSIPHTNISISQKELLASIEGQINGIMTDYLTNENT